MDETISIKCPLTDQLLVFDLLKNDNCVCEFMRQGKYWEKDLCITMSSMIDNILSVDDIILDIGCFIGTHTVPLSKKFKNNTIISIEASDIYSKVHIKNLELNSCNNVKHIQSIVTKNEFLNKLTTRSLDLNKKDNYGGIGVIHLDKSDGKLSKTITLDSLELKNIKLFKLDVEGHELSVIEGGINTIKTSLPLIFIEIWNSNVSSYIESDIFIKLFQLGYKLYKINYSIMDFVLIPSSYNNKLPKDLSIVN